MNETVIPEKLFFKIGEVCELAGAPADAAALSVRAAMLFERKGNVVSALRARHLAERLRSTPATS